MLKQIIIASALTTTALVAFAAEEVAEETAQKDVPQTTEVDGGFKMTITRRSGEKKESPKAEEKSEAKEVKKVEKTEAVEDAPAGEESADVPEKKVPHVPEIKTEKQQPKVIREAREREDKRQDTEWTAENIAKEPYLFAIEKIRQCDELKEKIKVQKIGFSLLRNKANRKANEAIATIARYEKFLAKAKDAYKKSIAATGTVSWPLIINGFEVDEENFNRNVDEALKLVKLEKSKRSLNLKIAKKIETRQNQLKKIEDDIAVNRRKFEIQAENVKMGQAIAEIESLKDASDMLADMEIELDNGDPEKISLDDLTTDDPVEQRNITVQEFLNS